MFLIVESEKTSRSNTLNRANSPGKRGDDFWEDRLSCLDLTTWILFAAKWDENVEKATRNNKLPPRGRQDLHESKNNVIKRWGYIHRVYIINTPGIQNAVFGATLSREDGDVVVVIISIRSGYSLMSFLVFAAATKTADFSPLHVTLSSQTGIVTVVLYFPLLNFRTL